MSHKNNIPTVEDIEFQFIATSTINRISGKKKLLMVYAVKQKHFDAITRFHWGTYVLV
jgi:predicted transposase YbfD/YdcC